MDIASPFPVTEDGNKYIMVVRDYFSKWAEAFAIRNQEATTVATMLIDINWISRFGVPMELHSRSRIRVASDRMKTRYDFKDNSVGFQAGDL